MTKLTDTEFKHYLQAVHDKISAVLDITKEKDINYGHQFGVELCQAKLTLNIYNGKKGKERVLSEISTLLTVCYLFSNGKLTVKVLPSFSLLDSVMLP